MTIHVRKTRLAAIACIAACLGAGCSGGEAPPPAEPPALEYLTPVQHLVRASMALRGVRPSIEEIEAVEQNPDWLPAIVEWYLDTPEFGATVRDMHTEQLLTGTDPIIFPAGFRAMGALEGMDAQAVSAAVMEAPVRLVEHVVMNDRPYSEIVTADYTLVDPVTSVVFGVPHDPAGGQWQVSYYADGRPAAGILSDSWLFTRHSSTYSNRNRGRASLVSRALLCYDFLSRQVEIDSSIDLADEEAVAHAIRNNAACVSCHQTLDPLAAYFSSYFPIYVPQQLERYPFRFFNPAFASVFRATEPGFFGQPGGDIRDLGARIAEDPRFSMCAARRFYSYLAQVEQERVPLETVSRYRDVLVDSGMDAKALARAIVLSDEFRVAGSLADEGAEDVRGLMKIRPEALARMVEDLTGHRWETDLPFDIGTGRIGRIDLMTDSFFGFEVLAGGTDGASVTRPTHTATATHALVMRGLAAQVAPRVVAADLGESDPAARRLLQRVSTAASDEASVRAQLADLHLRLYGERVASDDPSVDDSWTLFSSALASPGGDTERAWTVTLYAMLQDIRITYY